MTIPAVSVVMITRDRPDEAAATVARLRALPERPRVVVVVNGGPVPRVADDDGVDLVVLDENRAAGGRDVGVRRCTTPYVAFSDDDSWWGPGALARAADLLDAHPRLGLVQARVLVEPGGRPDPLGAVMARSPLVRPPGPGRPILGFMACGAVVRRDAFLLCGGFGAGAAVGGEEGRLALDLRSAGWDLRYVPEVVAHHRPSPVRDPAARSRNLVRHELLVAAGRLPAPLAARVALAALRSQPWRPALGALADVVRARPDRRVAAADAVRERALLLAHDRIAGRTASRQPERIWSGRWSPRSR